MSSCNTHAPFSLRDDICGLCLAEERDALRKELKSVTFWLEDLLTLGREINQDLMRFYEPLKGWPPHIEALLAPTDHDTALAHAKAVITEYQDDS